MTHKYSAGPDEDQTSSFRRAVLANAMRGGENVATGALMGAMLGGSIGFDKLPKDLVAALHPSQHAEIQQDVDAFLAAAPLLTASSL